MFPCLNPSYHFPMDMLSDEQLAEVLSHMQCPRALCIVACVSRRFRQASDLAFWYLCNWSGRNVQAAALHALEAVPPSWNRGGLPIGSSLILPKLETRPSLSSPLMAPGHSQASASGREGDQQSSTLELGLLSVPCTHMAYAAGRDENAPCGSHMGPHGAHVVRPPDHLGGDLPEDPATAVGSGEPRLAYVGGMRRDGEEIHRSLEVAGEGGRTCGQTMQYSDAVQQGSWSDGCRLGSGLSWRHVFFSQSFALCFNGINDYVELPQGVLGACAQDSEITVEVTFLVFPRPDTASDIGGMVQGGGVLIASQNREFGRSRRQQRLSYAPILYVGTGGYLHGGFCGIGGRPFQLASQGPVVPNRWHRASLSACIATGLQRLYLDGELQQEVGSHTRLPWTWPALPTPQSGAV
eukprot:jgi/Botrbrau1/21001/Bobra.0144s0019.2